ncbi:MAG: hypothetical protein OEV30_10190 [Ignavibacteria bacterium]|nr:hypothetical protein [Ignavibacteria bacterium]
MPPTLQFKHEHRPFTSRVPVTPGPDRVLEGTLTVVIEGTACLSISDLPMATLANRLKDWLDQGMVTDFSFDHSKSSERGVLTFNRQGAGWTAGSCRPSMVPDVILDDNVLAEAVTTLLTELEALAKQYGCRLFPDERSQHVAFAPLPPALHEETTGEPFKSCLVCKCSLLDPDCLYLIEKGFRKYPGSKIIDVIHDFALCTDCLKALSESYSGESRERVQAYFRNIAPPRDRFDKGLKEYGPDLDGWTSRCFGKGTPREELDEYQITCLCSGGEVMFCQYWPIMLGSAALDEVMALLSKETLDELDDFHGKHLGIPPEFRHLFRPVLV